MRGDEGFYTRVRVIPDAGHHVYSDQSEEFNKEVSAACDWSDNNEKKTKPKAEEEEGENVSS